MPRIVNPECKPLTQAYNCKLSCSVDTPGAVKSENCGCDKHDDVQSESDLEGWSVQIERNTMQKTQKRGLKKAVNAFDKEKPES